MVYEAKASGTNRSVAVKFDIPSMLAGDKLEPGTKEGDLMIDRRIKQIRATCKNARKLTREGVLHGFLKCV